VDLTPFFPMHKKALLACVLLSVAGLALAEGGSCPPGYYPVGGQGASGCAPIPEYGASDGAINKREAIQPVWEMQWGAIAVDFAMGKFGIGNAKRTKDEAENMALDECKKEGGSGCEIDLTYYNQCGAIAWGASDARTFRAESKEIASIHAIEACSKQTVDCKIYYADCSFPARVR
jgi:uncharacterized protein DUF4189